MTLPRAAALFLAATVLTVVFCGQTPAQAAPSEPAGSPAGALTESPESGTPAADMGLLMFVFVLAIFLGLELISKVPSQLHTPLMSGSNAISGITVVGALIAAGRGHVHGWAPVLLGTMAVAFAMINVVGGYLVTDRMLGMFKRKEGGS